MGPYLMREALAAFASEYGLPALFTVAFLAATLVPVSSEAALVAVLAAGVPVLPALVAASVGNGLACGLNYGLGRFFRERTGRKLQASRSGRKALAWMERLGPWSLALTWLPVIGDPLTVAAGYARTAPLLFVGIVIPLRVARYVALAAVAAGWRG